MRLNPALTPVGDIFRRLFCALWPLMLAVAADPSSADAGIRLAGLKHVVIPAEPLEAERSMAEMLQEELQALYAAQPTITTALRRSSTLCLR